MDSKNKIKTFSIDTTHFAFITNTLTKCEHYKLCLKKAPVLFSKYAFLV